MASSGDWITPRLWGSPWFEKPPLLYWMTAFAFALGVPEDAAPRLGPALLSSLFLVYFWRALIRLWDTETGLICTCVLATCGAWVAFSNVGATDLPLAATFSAAMLLAWEGLERDDPKRLRWAGACFGLAVLAKGLVPLVLALPLAWFARKRWKQFLVPVLIGLTVALPWYLAMFLHHGHAFVDEFFWRHHFARFANDSLAHQRPFWFYLPVLAGGLFPWIPLLFAVRYNEVFQNRTARFFLAWAAFGFLFFSASTNKLPGYLLPLFPALSALLGYSLSRRSRAGGYLFATVLLLVAVPTISAVLPQALTSGLSRAVWGSVPWEYALLVLPAAITVWVANRSVGRAAAVALAAACVAVGVGYLKLSAYPLLDRLVSARPIWRKIEPNRGQVCLDSVLHRQDRYGLNYYAVEPLAECESDPQPIRISGR